VEDRESMYQVGRIEYLVESQGIIKELEKARSVEKKERKSSRFAFESSDSGSYVVE